MESLKWLFHFLFFFFRYQSACSSPLSESPSSNHSCSLHERSSLLQFKQMFTIEDIYASFWQCDELGSSSYPKTLSWNETTNTDCCSWDGVTCDVSTGHVTGLDLSCCKLYGTIHLNSTLFELSHLQQLNLAFNHFNFSPFPPSFSRFTSLSHLNLSYSFLSGSIPSEITHLSKLISLDLTSSWDDILRLEPHNFKALLMNLTRLENLMLTRVNISSGLPDSLLNLSSLATLGLRRTRLNGKLPDSIGSLGFLNYLDLSHNKLSGPIPNYNKSGFQNLKVFRLSCCSLNGTLPSWLFTIPSLQYLSLRHNQLTGQIHEFQSDSQLEQIRLSHNKLHGTLPQSISGLVNLHLLLLSSNNLSGVMELQKFSNLEVLDLSENNISAVSNIGSGSNANATLPNLFWVDLSSSNINEFPEFLKSAENLRILDLSSNKLHGEIPKWVEGASSLKYLDLSNNYLQGPLLIPSSSSLTHFLISHNKLTGEIPSSICNLSSLEFLALSHNNLKGVIPHCLGNVSNNLKVLDLQTNGFHGAIPTTFANGSKLRTLSLNENHLRGPVPLSLTNCKSMEVLDLGNNNLYGAFPHWLESLPELQVLVLKSNIFHGPIGTSGTKSPFPKLQIFDISKNNFTGLLPERYFLNFKALMNVDNSNTSVRYMETLGSILYQDSEGKSSTSLRYMGNRIGVGDRIGVSYRYSVELVLKGVSIELTYIHTVFTTIDFSYNNFKGEIPNDIGKLQGLRLLNLSQNSLSDHLPSLLGNITMLESLDLSSNQLTGEIPGELTSLTFLAVLNLSDNHLLGPIPQGKQFNTFENNSYAGNSGLCGLPLPKKCGDSETQPQPPQRISQDDDDDEDFSSGFTWRIVLMGYGCGFVIGATMGFAMFLTGGDPRRKVVRVNQIGWRRSQQS